MNGKALLAGEEVGAELQNDRVEGAVQVLGQGRATELLQQDPTLHRPVPDAQHVVDLLRVKHQEVEPEQREEEAGHPALSAFFPGASGQRRWETRERLARRRRKQCPAAPSWLPAGLLIPLGAPHSGDRGERGLGFLHPVEYHELHVATVEPLLSLHRTQRSPDFLLSPHSYRSRL